MFFPNRIQSGYRLAAEIYSGNGYNAVQSSSRLVAKAPSETPRRTPPRQTSPSQSPSEPSPPSNGIQREAGSLADRTQLYKRPSRPLFAARRVSCPLGRGMFWIAHSIPPALYIVDYHHHHNESGIIALRLIPSGDLFPSSAVLAS